VTETTTASVLARFPGLRALAAGVVLLAVGAAGLAQTAPATTPMAGEAAAAAATRSGGLDPANMDSTVQACRDFYQYADGGWVRKNPVPAEYPEWGSFSELEERNRESLHRILEKAAKDAKDSSGAKRTDNQKIGDFYASCMDESAIEAQGAKPLAAELGKIAKIANVRELQAEIGSLQTLGINAAFQFGSEQDRKKSTEVIATAVQGGLGLPDRDYYTKTDDATKKLREQYVAHVTKMFRLLGDDAARADAQARSVLALETKLARASMTRVERRDPDATFNRMEPAKLKTLTPHFDWTAYFRDVHAATTPAAVNVQQPKFFQELDRNLTEVPLAQWKTYLRWQLVAAAAPALSTKFVDEDFDFNQRILQGTEKILPRWKRCVDATDAWLGFALGKAYVAEYFPPEAKERADRMVRNLMAALREDLSTLSWMQPETRKAALAKLDAFMPKIGYPDKWRDYSSLTIDRGAYVSNLQRATQFEWDRDLAKIGKPVDRTEWQLSPPTVNAYYNPALNEIVFPAGILQPPFFDAKADDAVNYGGIGAVIGHEMTHGFDDSGRKFDADGNLKEWWTEEDGKKYEARAACVEKQFSGYVFEGDQHLNGKLVLGESIADLGGLAIAYRAYRKSLEGKPQPEPIDHLTADQRFFLSWGRIWATNERPEFARLIVNTNPHPLGRFRAAGPPSNLPAFSEAFGCKPGDAMVRAERCEIW
jgi:predicted metalloendopeptidase